MKEDRRSIWYDKPSELENQPFWICYHACMLFLHGVFTYDQFEEVYKDQSPKVENKP